MTSWKKRLSPFIPSVFWRLRRRLFGWRWFRGRYLKWGDLPVRSDGYENPQILEKVLWASIEVRDGRAAFERDSVLFAIPSVESDLLGCLLKVAERNGGKLRVLDFGGSLGTTFWRHRTSLTHLAEFKWDIVEQPHFVEAGRKFLKNDHLDFFFTIAEAEEHCVHHVLLFSTVLQYLEDPHSLIRETVSRSWPVLIFNNLPLHDREPDYLMVQHVPSEIYSAVYPVWFFNRSVFLAHFADSYIIDRTYASAAVWNRGWSDYPSSGIMFTLKLNRGP